MNPILPMQYCVPDVEARIWSDGRIYLYGSFDLPGDTFYCSDRYCVFSSADLRQWTDHGPSFTLAAGHSRKAGRLFAPDCICRDGRYYLYYCADDQSEGVAVSDRPTGPFTDAAAVAGADGDGIDPAIFIDDDGRAYYFWGQFTLRGGRLKADMAAVEPDSVRTDILTEQAHGFHEGACIRKRGEVYYLVYTDISRGKASSLAYATSRAPLGPYVKGGIIIDNLGCDPATWNNHGSIAEFNGQWYVFYHRSSHGTVNSRRVCVEPIAFRADGGIDEVEMTTQGADGPIDARSPVEAWRACLLNGQAYIRLLDRTDETAPHAACLTNIHDGDWAAFKYLDFSGSPRIERFRATLGSAAAGAAIEVRLDSPTGRVLCGCDVPDTGGWTLWRQVEAELASDVSGIHAVYLVFRGGRGRLLDLRDSCFA